MRASSVHSISAKIFGRAAICLWQSCTVHNISHQPHPLMSDEVLAGVDEHLIHLGIFKRDCLRGQFSLISLVLLFRYVRANDNKSSVYTCCPTLACLPDRDRLVTPPVSLKQFTTFRMTLWEGRGPTGKISRYNHDANHDLSPHSRTVESSHNIPF